MNSITSDAPIPFLDLAAQRRVLGSRMDDAIMRVVDHGRFIMGPEVGELEERLASYCDVKQVVTCSSGTDALLLVLMAWEVGPGDAVFVPSFTFTSTAEVVALLGATPVFCDVEADTFNLDPNALEAMIKQTRAEKILHPRAVIPVDLFGQPADYARIASIAAEHGLHVLSDAAQSFGARQSGRMVGGLADATATSFFPAKPLGCYGDGGAVFTDDADLAALIRSLRIHGKGSHKYDTVRVGMNARLDTIQAAVLLAKLDLFDEEYLARKQIADVYSQHLDRPTTTPTTRPGSTSVWAQYTIKVSSRSKSGGSSTPAGEDNWRDALAEHLSSQNIPTAVYYPRPLHLQPAFSKDNTAPLPVSESLSEQVLSLPFGPYIRQGDVFRVIEAINRFQEVPR